MNMLKILIINLILMITLVGCDNKQTNNYMSTEKVTESVESIINTKETLSTSKNPISQESVAVLVEMKPFIEAIVLSANGTEFDINNDEMLWKGIEYYINTNKDSNIIEIEDLSKIFKIMYKRDSIPSIKNYSDIVVNDLENFTYTLNSIEIKKENYCELKILKHDKSEITVDVKLYNNDLEICEYEVLLTKLEDNIFLNNIRYEYGIKEITKRSR